MNFFIDIMAFVIRFRKFVQLADTVQTYQNQGSQRKTQQKKPNNKNEYTRFSYELTENKYFKPIRFLL